MRLDGNKIPVAWREPFGSHCYVDERPPGESILDIVWSIPNLPRRFVHDGVVCINGEVVPNEMWPYVRPKPASAQLPIAVTMHWPLRGGGGGGVKKILGIVAAIALVVVTAGIGAGLVGTALGIAAIGPGTFGAAALAGAVGIGGALAISALTAPPTVAQNQSGAATPDPGGNLDSIEAAAAQGNIIDRGGAIPRVVGTRKVFPPFACEPVVELVDQDEIVEALLVLNGPHALTDIRVDDMPIDEADDIEFETREGWSTDTAIELIRRQGRTKAPQLELSVHSVDTGGSSLLHQSLPESDLPLWHGFSSRSDSDEIWLHLLFPGGISKGDNTRYAVPLRIRFRQRDSSSPTIDWVNLPEIHLSLAGLQQYRTAILFKWVTSIDPIPEPPATDGFYYASINVPPQTFTPATPTAREWDASSYFDDGAGNDYIYNGNASSTRIRRIAMYENRVEVYLLAADFPQNGIYEFEIKRGGPYATASFVPSTYSFSGTILDWFWYFTSGGIHSAPQTRLNASDRVVLTRVVSIWNEHPIAGDDFALIAIKAINRSVRSMSVVASGYVRDWGGSDWDTWTTTSNPAPHFVDVLSGDQNLDPLPADLRDDDALVAWRTLCTSHGWTCDSIMNDMRTQDALSLLASCGYARPYQSDVYGVIVDNDRSADTPVQIFSRRNATNMRYEKAFARIPAGFTVTYRDESLDDDQAQITVTQTDPTSTDLTLYENISYDGLLTEAKVRARAQFDLDQANLRSTFYYLDTDIESIVCTRGSLVGVEHDILTSYAGDGYIVSKQLSGGSPIQITGITLDTEIPITNETEWFSMTDLFVITDVFLVGIVTGIYIRRTDGTQSAHTLSNVTGSTKVLTFATPFSDVSTIQGFNDNDRKYGCLVVAGEVGFVYRRLLIQSITPTKDLQASLVMVDEAPDLVRFGE